jgi:hypothetical protein
MQHEINTSAFVIRTETKVLKTVIGIENALRAIAKLDTIDHVGVFMEDKLSMSAVQFQAWGTRMHRLVNQNIGWDGKPVNA